MDGADTTPSNSKVIIQCTDPNDLFESLEPRLSARSPLKNLHWKSPTRPLRSIPNLNISVNREDKTTGSQTNVRRHQIPGLRETPYVKVYLLRCDDKEKYKESARKDVRQWIKANTPPSDTKSSSKSNENHDAFEWLILHVVLPNTPVASQPKSSKHLPVGATDSTDSVNSKSTWSGKSSSTVFDKLRADFNSSSKSAINRVAQVRLLDPGDKSTALSPADIEAQWQDLVESLKACILRSFDARVVQYENDIRERDAQRNLPGWNFCTFFVLKEGLARGFESVGLLDDALAVYDELSLGLDALVKEEAEKSDNDEHGALLRFSKESKNLLRNALESEGESSPTASENEVWDLPHILAIDRERFPFDVDRKKYRNLILANDVSSLDLRIYLFTRQMEILLRQGRADVSKTHGAQRAGGNLNIIADVAERGTQFISLAARGLRSELYDAWGGQEGLSDSELQNQNAVTGNIVSTWVWTAVMQILSEVLPLLGVDSEYWTGSLSIDALELSQNAEPGSIVATPESGPRARRLSLGSSRRSPSRDRSLDRSNRHSMMTNGTSQQQILLSRVGSQKILLWISKLVLIARQTLQSLEPVKSWHLGWSCSHIQSTNPPYIGSTDDTTDQDEAVNPLNGQESTLAGLDSDALRAATSSRNVFADVYLMLTVLTYRLLGYAKSYAGVHQVLTDLVKFEYAQKNYPIAARYLESVLGPLPRQLHRPADYDLLLIYAECLRHLDKPNDQMKCLIACLQSAPPTLTKFTPINDFSRQRLINQLFDLSRTISPVTLPLTNLFGVTGVSTTISHLQNRDGFSISLDLKTNWDITTPSILDEVKLRLASRDATEPRFLSLTSNERVDVRGTSTSIVLTTTVTTQGWYNVEELEIKLGNLRLLHHFPSLQENESMRLGEATKAQPATVPILVYPNNRSLDIKVRPSSTLHLAETKRLCIEIRTGHNNVKQCKLRLKTATAGLRLNVHDSILLDEDRPANTLRTAREGETLMMVIDDLEEQSTTSIEIPYTVEVQSEPSILLRIDVTYETDIGVFMLYDLATVNILLPLSVNVQDIYRPSWTYSRFTFSPLTLVPLKLIDCRLEENEFYDIQPASDPGSPVIIFPRQPGQWTVRLVPKSEEATRASRRLTLIVNFQSLDDLILMALEQHFSTAIREAGLEDFVKLLLSHLIGTTRGAWTEQDLEVAGLTQETEVWPFEDLDWHSILCAIDRERRPRVEHWLSTWHSAASPLKLSNTTICRRQVKLHVDVIPPPLIIVASIQVGAQNARSQVASIGQPSLAELELKLANVEDQVFDGSFELVTVADTWLIGGRRKGNIKLSHKPTRIQVVLFPQQLGHLMLPTVTVKCRKRARDQKTNRESWIEVNSEVYNTSHGQSILVTPDLQSTTVEVFGTVPDGGSGRLVATNQRQTYST